MTAEEEKESVPKGAKSDKLPREVEARVKQLRHKIREARRLVNQRFDELEAEADQIQSEQTG